MDKSMSSPWHAPKASTMSLLFLLLVVFEFSFGIAVKLVDQGKHVIMDNGLVQLTLSKPEGMLTKITYNGIDNLLEKRNEEKNRGYWDLVWNAPGTAHTLDATNCNGFKIIVQNEKQLEISFTRTWNPSLGGSVLPANVDKRYIMLEGVHGFYTYAIFDHLKGWPNFNLNLTRVVYKLDKELFRHMAVDEKRQRFMPLPDDRQAARGKDLAYPEAVHILKPVDPQLAGEVDDKYQYSSKNEDIKVHGWASIDKKRGPSTGFWQITPSFEYRTGGPFKQELTSHVGPISLTVFFSPHYMGQDKIPMFRNGEPWKKVYGPVFIYLNSGPPGTSLDALWKDAENQMTKQSWPYDFPASPDFPKSAERGSVHGRLLIRDRYVNKVDIPAANAYVGLALPGEVGSWQTEGKGYQFWVRAGPDGSFVIKNVRAGIYNLYATVPGFIGDYKSDVEVTIKPGDDVNLGDSVYMPPRTGPTLWEIGYPDRSASEFFIPNPDPNLVNPLFNTFDRFRQYGLWDQYSILYPKGDLVYTINASDHTKDWFYAHVPRRVAANTYQGTTWQIRFKLDNVVPDGIFTLRVALASASRAEMQVRFNDMNLVRPHFTTGLFGQDNAVARHGIHGLYWLFNIDVKSAWLVPGENTIYLTQSRHIGSFEEVMYDYIRFEGPSVAA